jgi:hypothetical protein
MYTVISKPISVVCDGELLLIDYQILALVIFLTERNWCEAVCKRSIVVFAIKFPVILSCTKLYYMSYHFNYTNK